MSDDDPFKNVLFLHVDNSDDDDPFADDPFADVLFVAADGINLSAPWRLRDYGRDGALTPHQEADLAERFNLELESLRDLSTLLGSVLNPVITVNLIGISRSVAVGRADKELRKALADVAAAQKRLSTGLGRVEELYISDPENVAQFEQARTSLGNCLHLLQDVLANLEQLLGTPGAALITEPTDKRVVQDTRREQVLTLVFGLWQRAGRTLTCTSDPHTSERRGPLIDFVNAVVVCVTDPPSTLPGETIFKEMKKPRRPWTAEESALIESAHSYWDT